MEVKKIYEIQNIGKGLIENISKDDLLLLYSNEVAAPTQTPNWDEVLSMGGSLTSNRQVNFKDGGLRLTKPVDGDYHSNLVNLFVNTPQDFDFNGRNADGFFAVGYVDQYARILEGFMQYMNAAVYRSRNHGIVYEGDYSGNFLPNSLITKKYLEDTLSKQNGDTSRYLNYDTHFTGSNYTLQYTDHNMLLFVNNGANNVTITIPFQYNADVLPAQFFAALIRTGTGEVTIVAETPGRQEIRSAEGFRINKQHQQVAIDMFFNNAGVFYLTGNTKV